MIQLAGTVSQVAVAFVALSACSSQKTDSQPKHLTPTPKHLTPTATPLASTPWEAANAILSTTVVPTFPSHTFRLTDYGGNGDGTTDNTLAFQQAITACNTGGGGIVEVPAGTYLTGAIHLLDNVNLHLDSGATLLFSGDASKYPLVLTRYEGVECLNHSPMIYAYGQTNIALTGNGMLDAGETAAWNKGSNRGGVLDPLVVSGVPPQERNVAGELRASFVEPYNCKNVLIQGVTLRNSQFWQIHPTMCTNVTVDGVTSSASGPNTDNCDPESCDHVVIKNNKFKAGDDNIAIKAGRDADGRRINVPSQNIVIWNNKFEGPVGAIVLGSEESGGIQNVYAYANATMGSGTAYAMFIKANMQRGGFVRNVNVDTFTSAGLSNSVVYFTLTYNTASTYGDYPPEFSGPFNFNNIVVDNAPRVLDLEGLPNDQIGDCTLTNSTFTNILHTRDTIENVRKVTRTKVKVNGESI